MDGGKIRFIPRDHIGKEPMMVLLQDMTDWERNQIPFSRTASLTDLRKAIAPYIQKWDLRARRHVGDDDRDIPAPGSLAATEMVGNGNEWTLLEFLDQGTVTLLGMAIANPTLFEHVVVPRLNSA